MREQRIVLNERTKLLKAVEVAELMNVSRAHAYQLMRVGEIRTVHVGNSIRVRPNDLLMYIEENISPRSMQSV